MKVLIIDDSPTVRLQFKKSLEHIDPLCEVLEASRAHLGWALMEKHAPDLVLLDMILPDLPGASVLKMLREAPHLSRIKMIIVTGSGGPLDRERWSQLGADGFLVKPVSTAELKQEINRVLAKTPDAAKSPDDAGERSRTGGSAFL